MDRGSVSARARRGAAWLALVLVALLGALLGMSAGSAADTSPAPVFAGDWSTFGGTGTLHLSVTDATTGQMKVQSLGGGAGCASPTVWYVGTYSVPGDSGQVAACSPDPQGLTLAGFYATIPGSPSGRHGSFTVGVTCSDWNTFSGEYAEASDGSSGTYPGTRTSTPPADPCATTTTTSTSTTSTSTTTTTTTSNGGPPPPVSTPEKDAARAVANDLVLITFFTCSGYSVYVDFGQAACAITILAFGRNQEIIDDPPATPFTQVGLSSPARVLSALKLFCPKGCASAGPAATAYAQQQSLTNAAVAGLATAGNRFSAAKQAGSSLGMLLQDGVGKAYAGELADALVKLNARGAALAAALKRAGHTVALNGAQLAAARRAAQQGLPPRIVSALEANGVSPATFQQSLAAALASAPSSISFSRLLGATERPGPFRAANRTITLAQVGAIIDVLAGQRAISARAQRQLTADLNAVGGAKGSKRAHALSKLQSDIASNVHRAAGTLLHFAVVGLS